MIKYIVIVLLASHSLMTGSPKKLAENMLSKFPDSTQISIAIVTESSTDYIGLLKTADEIVEVDNKDHIYEIGSISKVFSSILLSNAILNSEISANQTISNILKEPISDSYSDIRLMELSNHTSGLPRLPGNIFTYMTDMSNPYKFYTYDVLYDYVKSDTNNYSSGIYDYSNFGVSLLTLGLINHYGKSYEELLEDNIFSLLGMNSSTTDISKLSSPLIRGRDQLGNLTSNWEMSGFEGTGGILSNISDMEKFSRAFFAPDKIDLFSNSLKETFKVNDNLSLGMGWHISPSYTGKRTYHWHNGGTGGYSSIIVIDAENQNAVIMLTNVSAFNPNRQAVDDTAFGIMEGLD